MMELFRPHKTGCGVRKDAAFLHLGEQMMKKSSKTLLSLLALLCLVGLLAGLYLSTRPDTVSGVKSIAVQVVHADESLKIFYFKTTEEYLGDVLLSEGLIKGDPGPYGLYITEVDGEVADYAKDKAYWALFKGNEYASQGIDQTVFEDGDIFRLVYTIG